MEYQFFSLISKKSLIPKSVSNILISYPSSSCKNTAAEKKENAQVKFRDFASASYCCLNCKPFPVNPSQKVSRSILLK
jgi:hypothetical protein